MSLPAPNLDDRRFQDIVDEAKRRITRYCPEWTDHNVSDPGVALIELFAWMTEMILYRVNQVPAPAPARPRPPRMGQGGAAGDGGEARTHKAPGGGSTPSGEAPLLLPARREPLAIGAVRAHWLRCRLVDVVPGQPPYHISPMLDSVDPLGLGGAVAAHHAEPAPAELLGSSDGRPGQTFEVRRAPVLARRP